MLTFAVLAAVVCAAFAAPTPSCVPTETSFVWKVPCDGQTFDNRLLVNNVTASQGGVDIHALPGMDISLPLDLVASIVDNYGESADPKLDIDILEYGKTLLGKCEWKNVPTLGLLHNLNACDMVENCHLQNNPTVMKSSVSVKDVAGPLYGAISIDMYYGIKLTFKDGNTPLLCVYAQDIVVKK